MWGLPRVRSAIARVFLSDGPSDGLSDTVAALDLNPVAKRKLVVPLTEMRLASAAGGETRPGVPCRLCGGPGR